MRRVLTALLLSTLAIGTVLVETLHFGTTTASPPFITANGKNQPVGFGIDPIHALCQQMQAQCQFTAQRFDTLIPTLRFRKFDAVITGMEAISMREKQVAFSRPYRQALSRVVVVNKDVAHTFADLKAKEIGVVKGTLHQRYLRNKQKAVQVILYGDVASALAALKVGEIIGIMSDFATLDAQQQENPDYAIMDERATDPAYYGKQYVIAVRKDDTELLNTINDALTAVMATPDFQRMQQKWFK